MRFKKIAMILTAMLAILQSAIAEEKGKIYIAPGLAFIAEDGIFVQINNEFIPVASLSIDES